MRQLIAFLSIIFLVQINFVGAGVPLALAHKSRPETSKALGQTFRGEESNSYSQSNKKSEDPSSSKGWSQDRLLNFGLSKYMQELKFQPANLAPVSVFSIELFIHSLEILPDKDHRLTRLQFETGKVSPYVLQEAYEHIRTSMSQNPVALGLVGVNSEEYRKVLAELPITLKNLKDPAYRRYYGDIYNSSLKPMLEQVLHYGADPLKLAKAIPERITSYDQSGRTVDYLLYEFEAKDGRKIPAQLMLSNSDHLLKYRPLALLGKSARETFMHMPSDLAMFYVAANIMAIGEQLVAPLHNPHAIQDAMGMFFNKNTIIDVPEVGNILAFMTGARFASESINHVLLKKGVSVEKRMLLGPYQGFAALAVGSLVASLLTDLGTTGYNCTIGYFTDEKNFKSADEQLEYTKNCDLAFDRWTQDNMASKYFGETLKIIAAAAASSASTYAFSRTLNWTKSEFFGKAAQKAGFKYTSSAAARPLLTHTASTAGKAFSRALVTGIEVATTAASTAASASPDPRARLIGWGGRVIGLVVFLTWDKIIDGLIMKSYNSWDLATEADRTEDRLLRDFHEFSKSGGVIRDFVPVKSCGHILQRWKPGTKPGPSRLLDPGSGVKCYDNTVFQTLDEYASDQKTWRDFILSKMFAAYNNWIDQTSNLVSKYQDTKKMYAFFVDSVNNNSSFVFGDTLPYGKLNGLVLEDLNIPPYKTKHIVKYVGIEDQLSLVEMHKAQTYNILYQSSRIQEMIEFLDTKAGKDKFLQSLVQKDFGGRSKAFSNDQLLRKYLSDLKKINSTFVLHELDKEGIRNDLLKGHTDIELYLSNNQTIDTSTFAEALKSNLAAINKLWSIADQYNGECTNSTEEASQFLCFFSELRKSFGLKLGVKPSSDSTILENYLKEASYIIDKSYTTPGSNPYPKYFRGIETPNSAIYLHTAMACGLDLSKGSQLFKFSDNSSSRVNTSPSITNRFGFRMDFHPPQIIDAKGYTQDLCHRQYHDQQNRSGTKLSFDKYSWALKGKRYSSLVELLRDNLRPEVKVLEYDENTGEWRWPWWDEKLEKPYHAALKQANSSYKQMVRDHFLPAIYGYRSCQNQADKELEAALMGDVDIIGYQYGASESPQNQKNSETCGSEFVHMYPPRYLQRPVVRSYTGSRHQILPVAPAVHLEFEFYLDELLKPLFFQISYQKGGHTDEHVAKAENFFQHERNWVLASLEMLLNYHPDQSGKIRTDRIPVANHWLSLNLLSLGIKMGLPVQKDFQDILAKLNQLDSENPLGIDDAGLQMLMPSGWDTRGLNLKERKRELQILLKKYREAQASTSFDAFDAPREQGGEPPQVLAKEDGLSEDQKLFINRVFVKMDSVRSDLFRLMKVVNDVNFDNVLETSFQEGH